MVLLVAAGTLAGAGGAAAGLGVPGWMAGAVGAVSALTAGMVTDQVTSSRDGRRAALAARDQVLDSLTARVRDAAADPLALLRADQSPMPFCGRRRQLRQLAAWRDDEKTCPVLLLSGSAGVGKSRLALEFALRAAADGWAAGWLRAGTGDRVIDVVAACGDPAVILVDDADGRADLVPLLDSLARTLLLPERATPIRVVLVTRSTEGLRASLVTRLEERHAWIASQALRVGLVPEGGPDDRTRWFGQAVAELAKALGQPVPALPEAFPSTPGDAAEPFVMIQARALLAVLDGGVSRIGWQPWESSHQRRSGRHRRADPGSADPRDLPVGRVAEALLAHEQRRWLSAASAWGPVTSDAALLSRLQARCIAAMVLLGVGSDQEADAVLRRIPELRGEAPGRRYAIASAVRTLYPARDSGGPRIRPDVIGEWLLVTRLAGDPELTAALRARLTDKEAVNALGFLARAADWLEAAGPLFGEFAGGDVRRLVLAAAEAALAGEVGRRLLDAVIARQLGAARQWTLGQLDELDGLVPPEVLPLTRAAIADRVVALRQAQAPGGSAGEQAVLAASLTDLAARLRGAGQHQQALQAWQQAVALYRGLAARDPAAHRAALAAALRALGGEIVAVGHHDDALDVLSESVALYRALDAVDPSGCRGPLALAIDQLGVALYSAGRHAEAIGAVQEAIDIYTATDDADLGNVAMMASHAGVLHSAVGQHEQAAHAHETAITWYRSIAADTPSAEVQAVIARALNNLSGCLNKTGRRKEAIDALGESVSILRALAGTGSGAFQADLALSLDNLCTLLEEARRYPEALTAGLDATAILRSLAAADPLAHQPGLSHALDGLGKTLSGLGRHQEGLSAIREAVDIRRALAEASPAAFQEDLALSLNNLGKQFLDAGRREEALRAVEESADLFLALADSNPVIDQALLASTLRNLGVLYDIVGQHEDAVLARTKMVQVYRTMAERVPDMYQAEYRAALGALLREYEQRGMRYEAIMHDLPAAPGVAGNPVPNSHGTTGLP
jgi:tetratricopeptide (TPR) repeat protein